MAFPASLTNLSTLAQATKVTPTTYNDARTAINNLETALGINFAGIPSYTSSWTPTFSTTTITSPAVGTVPLTVNGFSSGQTANILNLYQNSGGALLYQFKATGSPYDAAFVIYQHTDGDNNAIIGGSGTGFLTLSNRYDSSGVSANSENYILLGTSALGTVNINASSAGSTGTVALWTGGSATLTANKAKGITVAHGTAGVSTFTGASGGSTTVLTIATGADSNVGLALKANSATQSGDMLQIQNSSGGVVTRINEVGALGIGVDPAAFLHVAATTGDPLLILTEGGTYGAYMRFDSTAGAGGRKYDIISTAAGAGEGQGLFLINDNTSGLTRWGIDSDGTVIIKAGTGMRYCASTMPVLADGDGRMVYDTSADAFLLQKRVSSAWVTKHTFSMA